MGLAMWATGAYAGSRRQRSSTKKCEIHRDGDRPETWVTVVGLAMAPTSATACSPPSLLGTPSWTCGRRSSAAASGFVTAVVLIVAAVSPNHHLPPVNGCREPWRSGLIGDSSI
ncbi:hypothetical protein TIFTF001_024080 [Ficus carica]|uniref:Uncharacterized protein n=1 Tax=Ficus carica TaxID=3494 RepID=A0AA88AKR2_FICCA|nr:hypothetical protein TIFTF001_024080 [Ficus carica]